jgi:ketosteroid isomerase-like protein
MVEKKMESKMKRSIAGLLVVLTGFAAFAAQHATVDAEVQAAVDGFNTAYATNDADEYFGYYADGATVFFSGARQDMAAYEEEWRALIAAGDGVVANELSDIVIQVMSGGTVAISTYFVDNQTRSDGNLTELTAFETDVWHKIDGEWKVVSLHYTELSQD